MKIRFGVIHRMLFAFFLLFLLTFSVSASAKEGYLNNPDSAEPPPDLITELGVRQSADIDQSKLPQGEYILRERYGVVQQDLLGEAAGQGSVRVATPGILLNLFDDASYLAVADRVISHSSGELVWYGTLDGVPGSSVILSVHQDATVGTIWEENRHFRIVYVSGGVNLIQELQTGQPYPELEPRVLELPVDASSDQMEQFPQEAADDGSIIDVLVVYTPASRMIYGGTSGINALIQTAIAETNQAYINSQINTQLRLVHSVEVNYIESGSMYTDLDHLEDVDGVIDEVHALRDIYKADLVSMIEESTQYCGLAELMRTLSAGFENRAFSVVASSCATGYYSFGHETAHNMGSHHDRESVTPGDQGLYPYSYGFIASDDTFRTIMAYGTPCGNCPRIQYFSNPDVTYNGKPTGVYYLDSLAADNHRSINNARVTVASFRTAPTSAPAAFSKINPGNNTSGYPTTLTFSWGSSSGVMEYEICLDTIDNTVCDGQWINVGTSTSVTLTGLQLDADYYWQVRAKNTVGTTYANSGTWWHFSMLATPGAFSKNNPADNATGMSINPTLSWGSSSDAVSYEYCIDTSNDDSCAGNVWTSVGGSTSVGLNSLSYNTTYYWQVRARNSTKTTEANAGDWWQFTTALSTPGAFSKTVPAYQTVRTPVDLTLAWGVSSGAVSYEYCLDAVNNNFCDDSWTNLGSSTSKVITGLSANTSFYWQVRAVNGGGTTYANGGEWWRFTTTDSRARLLLVDDDDNIPNVITYYTDALNALRIPYDLWDTNNSDIEPGAAALDVYRAVVWFSGDEWEAPAGPGSAGEVALGSYLDAGNCLFVSSQDYYYSKGLTTFMDTYLGVSSVSNDVSQTQVTGVGALSEFGTVTLSFPTGYNNYTDKIFPDAGAGSAWLGLNDDPAGIFKESGVYRTAYWGFPFETLPDAGTRAQAMGVVLNWCSPGFASPLVINEIDVGVLDAIEIHNKGTSAVDLSGWKVYNYASNGSLFATYTFPAFTLDAGAYVIIYEGSGVDTSSELFTGFLFSWAPEAGAAALIDPNDVAADFLRWGTSIVLPPPGTKWSGTNPLSPEAGKTLGRDEYSQDTDQGFDWHNLDPTLGLQNMIVYSNKIYLPLVTTGAATADAPLRPESTSDLPMEAPKPLSTIIGDHWWVGAMLLPWLRWIKQYIHV